MNVMEMYRLDGKVALVTGGARNLGFDMALALAEAGADVAITSRKPEQGEASARKIAEATGRATMSIPLDVKDEAQVEAAIDAVLAKFGKLDILVNNAGNVISSPETAPLETRPLSEWNEVMETNVTGTFLCSKHAIAKWMMPQRTGVIINIGSVTGVVGKDRRVYEGTRLAFATLDYHAAKGAVVSMTRDMAVYLAPYNIRVNCISPAGFYRNQPEQFVEAYTKTIPMGRMGVDGKEMKGPVVFLASEASSFCTGHNLLVDGGLTIW